MILFTTKNRLKTAIFVVLYLFHTFRIPFYAPTFTIEKDSQEITTSNNTMFKASLWLRDFLTKWNDEVAMEAKDITIQSANDNEYTVKVLWSVHDAEGKKQKQQEVTYTLDNEDGLRIIASTV